ncbi:gelsolin, cytoplasmic isoform X1 [Schistocerca serialis cubense]|uniref:gelsolin, cytoplasmic isoform X1 n=1 Tax=Schistocerca serialis cubense TaxID=2023355 RepID=UPI00214E2C2A|nr:gelsolin, cytoplasmic isoform X1 [Schistocerca serialis cubense]
MVPPAFEDAGKQAGIAVWRVENFEPVAYPKKDYGKFHTGDSYIVLNTVERKGTYNWDIHFWLGKETSQDEAGAAAILSVELDDHLGGSPVQHREVQDHESQLFLSYFRAGVRYLPGGVASGFHHVDPDAVEKRLFQVKGKRNIRVRQVDVNISSMNKGDCFILDAGKTIYVYMGATSKRTEKLKAISAANQIRDQDHAGRAKVIVIDEYSNDVEVIKFFEELGSGSPTEIPDEDEGGDDVNFEKTQEAVVTLYRVSDAGGEMVVEKVGEKPLHQDMLQSNDCFILDTVTSGIYVWIGRRCTKDEKVEAMKRAQSFLTTNNYPVWTKVQRIVEGGEPSTFKQYFSGWREAGDQIGLGRIYTVEQIAASMPEPDFDPSSLHAEKIRLLAKNAGRAFGFMPDDGSGKAEVYRIEDFELVPIDPATYGMFFGGDSYVIKYTYEKDRRESYIIYFWQGKDSTQDERAASAIHAVRLDDEVGGKAVQVRVTQGNEPRHFLRIFKGKMIIFMGGKASGFKNLRDHDTYDTDGTRLFQVRGTCPDDVRAVQVPEVASSLQSDDVFVLEIPGKTFVWLGKLSNDEEKEFGAHASALVSPDVTVTTINEGDEPDEFWGALGGKGDYLSEFDAQGIPLLGPRLFHCRITITGRFRVEEIPHYKQEDLDEDDIMVLDSGDEIYVWVGSRSTQEEKEKSLKMAETYLKTDPSDRRRDRSVIITVKQGEEPVSFTALFPDWDPTMWESLVSYEDVKNQLAEFNSTIED